MVMREVQLSNGKIWYAMGYGVPNGARETSAQVVVPIEAIDGMTGEEIGQAVRAMCDEALRCQAIQLAEQIQWGMPEKPITTLIETRHFIANFTGEPQCQKAIHSIDAFFEASRKGRGTR